MPDTVHGMDNMQKTTSIWTILFIGFYALTLVVLGIVLFMVATNAAVVWQVEAELGHTLACDEAYNHREIDAHFYPERRTHGDILYLYSLASPVILLAFVVLTDRLWVITRRGKQTFKRWRYGLLGLGVLTFIALVAYSPIIYIMGCALE